jgi:hypothetical protein
MDSALSFHVPPGRVSRIPSLWRDGDGAVGISASLAAPVPRGDVLGEVRGSTRADDGAPKRSLPGLVVPCRACRNIRTGDY